MKAFHLRNSTSFEEISTEVYYVFLVLKKGVSKFSKMPSLSRAKKNEETENFINKWQAERKKFVECLLFHIFVNHVFFL